MKVSFLKKYCTCGTWLYIPLYVLQCLFSLCLLITWTPLHFQSWRYAHWQWVPLLLCTPIKLGDIDILKFKNSAIKYHPNCSGGHEQPEEHGGNRVDGTKNTEKRRVEGGGEIDGKVCIYTLGAKSKPVSFKKINIAAYVWEDQAPKRQFKRKSSLACHFMNGKKRVDNPHWGERP